jgi:adenosine kinase
MKVILTGSIAFDYLMRFPGYFKDHILAEHLEKISLSFLVEDMVRQYGGVSANIAYTLAMLGGKAKVYSAAGQDFPEYACHLEEVGVDVSGVRVVSNKFTASFFVNTDMGNGQIASFYTGAMADSVDMLIKDSGYEAEDYLMISPTDPRAMENYIDEAKALGLRMLFDPGQQIVRMNGEILKRGLQNAYGLFVNEYEFELLQKATGMTAAEIINAPNFTVVTLGPDGARLIGNNEEFHVPAIHDALIVDPTGVGDAFRAGFMRGYMEGFGLELCGQMGTATASLCLAQSGSQNHHFTLASYKDYFRSHFNDNGKLELLNK